MNADMERLQGTWRIVTLEVGGVKMSDNDFKGSKIVVKGNSFTTISMGAIYNGTFQTEETNTPRTLDLTFTEGPHQGKKSLAIYELNGDTWKMCLAFAGLERPTDFVTAAGSSHALETLQREPGNSRPNAMPI